MTPQTPLDRANALIALLVNALDTVERATTLDYAKGAAEYAIKEAARRQTRNAHGYLVIQ